MGQERGPARTESSGARDVSPGRSMRVALPRCHKDMGASGSTCTAQMQTLTNENRKAKPD